MVASVIIPTRNRSRLVIDAIQSALTAREVGEVIVVDDNSEDDTARVLEAFGSKIHVIRGYFGSAGAARNAGAAAAGFPFLGFLDSDDEMLPEKIPVLAELFSDPGLGLAHGRIEVMDEGGAANLALTRSHEELFAKAEEIGTSYPSLARHCALFTSATLIRREAFEQVGGYDPALRQPHEDLDLYLRLSVSWRIAYSPHPVARYRIWAGNFDWQSHAEGKIAVAQKHLSCFPDLSPRERSVARYGFLRSICVSAQTLLRTRQARRNAMRAIVASPASAFRDWTILRILTASFLPQQVLRKRRPKSV